jgi:hypothetical protein
MAQKAPMIGVVVSPSLRDRIKEMQKRERRTSQSEFCALLLEYAITRMERRPTMALASLLEAERLGGEEDEVLPSTVKVTKKK